MMQVKAKELRVEEAERRLEQRERDVQDALAAAEEGRPAGRLPFLTYGGVKKGV